MNIVSYRGPGMAGGVSSALERIWNEYAGQANWWHLSDNEFRVASGLDFEMRKVASFAKDLVKGHYDYCNEFLWPVLHDLPQYATYRAENRDHYNKFNELLARLISYSPLSNASSFFFLQDYQLGLLPAYLKRSGMSKTSIFWHIPWPKNVREEHVEPLKQLVKGLLASEAIGFHVQEYGLNFLDFVEKFIPGYIVDRRTMTVRHENNVGLGFVPSRNYAVGGGVIEPRARLAYSARVTKIVVAPLGLDFDHWSSMSRTAKATIWQPALAKKPYILSVDRADYTKGVSHRLRAINAFFEKYPQWRGEVSFAQIAGRTRPGIEHFDNYWNECKELDDKVHEKWHMGNWQPLVWLESSFSQEQLSLLYKNAAAMLVNPVRDGLNLTAKEYVASQGPKPGVLCLSKGAGAWHELGDHCLEVAPEQPEQIADAIAQALVMSPSEKAIRMDSLIEKVKNNHIEDWWDKFSTNSGADRLVAEDTLREIS
jgi:trehalose 6-phosphate synthase